MIYYFQDFSLYIKGEIEFYYYNYLFFFAERVKKIIIFLFPKSHGNEHVRAANTEIASAHSDLERRSEIQKILETELKQARSQLNEYMLKNVELERVRKEHEIITQRVILLFKFFFKKN